jgi:predicted outer membrane repeat protein
VAQLQNGLILEDVRFISNNAGLSGGALWVASAVQGIVNASGAVFIANTVSGLMSHPSLHQAWAMHQKVSC